MCPITHTDKKFPTRVKVKSDDDVDGFIMCEQLRSVDYEKRDARLIGKLNRDTLNQVLEIIEYIIR